MEENDLPSNTSSQVGIKITHDHMNNNEEKGASLANSETVLRNQKEILGNKSKRIRKGQALIQSKIVSSSVQASA